jgi:signal transduction histidine kinase
MAEARNKFTQTVLGPCRRLALAGLFTLTAISAAQAQSECERFGTPLEAQQLAERAAQHLADQGPGRAFTDFMTPNAGFMQHDLYVFVFDDGGRMWVNGRFPGLIGSNVLRTQDASGRRFLMEGMLKAQRDGSAWVEYDWYNPCTAKVMPKSSHLIQAGPFFVGVGAYGTIGA